jgi:ethanolamine ammonia-lyase small subunit
MSEPDPWHDLRAYTAARLALGRSGSSLPTAELLRFGLAHAQARDAVQRPLDAPAFAAQLQDAGMPALQVASAATDRTSFLLRPDLGRRLSPASRDLLAGVGDGTVGAQTAVAGSDLLLVVADGLSAPAIERNALPMLDAIRRAAPLDWRIGPVVLATQGRVALGDEIGQLLGAALVAMLIGERPGLSSPDSLGIYLTWQPRLGRSDAERNCISNIRPEGLSYEAAAHRLWWLCREARQLQLTGVQLKDRSSEAVLGQAEQAQRIGQDSPRTA